MCVLSYADDEMKNGRSHEVELPAEVAEIILEYIKDHRPYLPGANGPYLFPGRNGGPRHHNTMREDFQKAVFKHTGLQVNPHFTRHATAMIAINQDPANLPMVSQRLGHTSTKTAADFYLANVSLPSSR
ncbi:site-specific integrase, partial [Corallococcus praedator]